MSLPQDHVKALDQLRTRLSHLSTALNSLHDNINSAQDPLPPWPVLQGDATVAGVNLQELASVLNEQRQLFASMHAYPLPAFPGSTQEVILQGLLRKKLDPAAATWIEESLPSENGSQSTDSLDMDPFSAQQMEALWSWAKPASREFLAPLIENGDMESDYTLKEQELGIENVVTGVKSLDEDEDAGDEEEDAEGKMDLDNKPKSATGAVTANLAPTPLEDILRFTSGRPLEPRANGKT